MANVPINIRTKYDDKGMRQLERDAKRTQKQIGALTKGLAVGAAAVIGAEGLQFAQESIAAAREQIEAEEQLAAALQSTGYAAGFSRKELQQHAAALQATTNYGDEATIAMQSVLLTFTQIRGDNFLRATEAIQDMATRLDTDLKSAALQVGKALNDPVKGATALQRAGIQLTAQQREMIETMVEANDVAGAQGVILDELEVQFGGAAEAGRDALTGLANAWGDVKESIGLAITPTNEFVGLLETASSSIASFTRGLSDLDKATDIWVDSAIEAQFGADSWAQSVRDLTSTFTPDPLITYIGLLVGDDGVRAAYDEVTGATKEATDAQADFTMAMVSPDLINAVKQANEQIAKERERRQKTARDTIKELQSIEEDAFDDRLDAAKDYQKSIADLQKKARRDAQNDARRTARALEKVDKDAAKQITKVRQNTQKQETIERKREQVETLSDRRLFMLDLQHMAEEGDAIGIRRALERREVEEEIAKEQAQVEAQIAEQQQKDEVAQIRETANERKTAITEQANLEQQLRKEDLAQRIADETEYYNERQELIEQGRLEAIAEVGRELSDIEGMTRGQLTSLIPMASQLGRDVGASFATGITEGYAQNAQVSQIVNQNVTVTATGPSAQELGNDMASGVQRMMQQYNNLLRRSFAQ